LFHFGADDTNPSPNDMQKLDTELTRLGKPHEFFAYPDAGHAFLNFVNPQRYREDASLASWPRTLDFLARQLG
jgi:carboxymethylenebutenolidase